MAANEPSNPPLPIPPPEIVRARLTERLREVNLLRSLLRLSERAARDRRSALVQEGAGRVE
jgi:hypothetical protein